MGKTLNDIQYTSSYVYNLRSTNQTQKNSGQNVFNPTTNKRCNIIMKTRKQIPVSKPFLEAKPNDRLH